ncbi:MAG: histidine kinase [Planctomycetes bacterium]|nr:histidine kinase [Planctomycetota bacterium]
MSHPARSRLREFHSLIRFRIMDVILVSTPYDKFVLEDAGELAERLTGEFRNLDLHYPPGITGVTSGAEAIELAQRGSSGKLIITTPNVPDMDPATLVSKVREAGLNVPVLLLAWESGQLAGWNAAAAAAGVEGAFLWQGDARLLMAMAKMVEDRRNVAHDVQSCGVQVIIVIEDLVRHWSSFLPRMYQVLLKTSQRVVREGLNLSQRILRMRARPKILLCTCYEEAEACYLAYHADVMGIVSDVEFPRNGIVEPLAGADFVRMARRQHPDLPIILHSSRPEYEVLARDLSAGFLLKGSSLMLQQLERVMLDVFGFGDFVFKTESGNEVARAADLGQLQHILTTLPAESLLLHSRRNHFSRWLKARTEFDLAQRLRPMAIEDFEDVEAMRRACLEAIADYRLEQSQHIVAEFDSSSFDFASDFYRIGGDSIGGKARGVAFIRRLLGDHAMRRRFPGVQIRVPPTVVIGSKVFDDFLDANDLRTFALECDDDDEIVRRFEAAPLPDETRQDLAVFLEHADWPLAVRSSSLLEDSQQQPFTGVYDTRMLRNNDPDAAVRLQELMRAIKCVYASTFAHAAKGYIAATSYRLEEEKMAVMVQRVVGALHNGRWYPDFAGVVRSHNFYPLEPMVAEDGIAAVALGLGCAVMHEASSLRFCPRYPQNLLELSTVEDVLANTQRRFWALPLDGDEGASTMREAPFDLSVAEQDGVLANVASTYSAENDAIHDGTSRKGQRVVTFAPILKLDVFPLAAILDAVVDVGEQGMGMPVEIEFAVTLSRDPGREHDFAVLQVRPMALLSEVESLDIGPVAAGDAIVHSMRVLGHGRLEGIRDLVVVDFKRFDRADSRAAAEQIDRVNARLTAAGRPYVLIGVGRLGSRDPWLGIPVTWDQVSGARAIVEAGYRDLHVTPSQGTHFFQNLTAFHIGYFTVNPELGEGMVDWEWLDAQPPQSAEAHVRHIRLEAPLIVLMNGKKGEGVILKPASTQQPKTRHGRRKS